MWNTFFRKQKQEEHPFMSSLSGSVTLSQPGAQGIRDYCTLLLWDYCTSIGKPSVSDELVTLCNLFPTWETGVNVLSSPKPNQVGLVPKLNWKKWITCVGIRFAGLDLLYVFKKCLMEGLVHWLVTAVILDVWIKGCMTSWAEIPAGGLCT